LVGNFPVGSTLNAVPFHSHHRFVCLKVFASSETYTLSLHDALPIFAVQVELRLALVERLELVHDRLDEDLLLRVEQVGPAAADRSEEHTSELQSRENLVCRLLPEKKKCRAVRRNMALAMHAR